MTQMDADRILSATPVEDDATVELSLRPRRLREYIGQQKVKANLDISIAAARKRRETLDHVLLFGPPGLGKTTLANIIANEMDATMRSTSGPALEKPGDLVAIITNLEVADMLFIDEIHRLPAPVEEVLYSAMEDFYVDVVIGQGPSARTLKVEVPRFTLVGATTRERFNGGPAGVNALASSIVEDRGTIEDLYEPYLIQIGFLQRTPRGRIASKLAYDHLGYATSGVRTQKPLF